MTTNGATAFESPAIVELFGHQVIAGQISEQVIGGQGFIRIDVPAVDGQPGYTKFFGPSAIYAITPTDETTMLEAARRLRKPAISQYVLPAPSEPEDDLEEPDF